MMESTKPFYGDASSPPSYTAAAPPASYPSSPGAAVNFTNAPSAGYDAQGVSAQNPYVDGTQGNGPSGADPATQATYKGLHPVAAFFHVIFKIASVLVFIFGGLGNFVIMFVVCVLLLAADFWVTKNVTGRILVCLRWWNHVKDDGTTEWIFESAPDADKRVHPFDRMFFWGATVAAVVVWGVMIFMTMFKFTWLPLAIIGFVLSGANASGYFKCSRDAKLRITQYMLSQAAQHPEVIQTAATTVTERRK